MVKQTFGMPTLYLKHRGLFNQTKLVKAIQHWFDRNGYTFNAGKFKVKPTDAEYEMSGTRKITEYVEFKVEIHFWLRDLKDVDVVQDGEKQKMREGGVQVEIGGDYTLDFAGRFGGNKFMQWLQDFYHNYVIKQTITDVWEDDLFLKMNELMDMIKNELGIEAKMTPEVTKIKVEAK